MLADWHAFRHIVNDLVRGGIDAEAGRAQLTAALAALPQSARRLSLLSMMCAGWFEQTDLSFKVFFAEALPPLFKNGHYILAANDYIYTRTDGEGYQFTNYDKARYFQQWEKTQRARVAITKHGYRQPYHIAIEADEGPYFPSVSAEFTLSSNGETLTPHQEIADDVLRRRLEGRIYTELTHLINKRHYTGLRSKPPLPQRALGPLSVAKQRLWEQGIKPA